MRGPAGRDDSDIEKFPQYLDDVVAMMSAGGVRVASRMQDYMLKATPAATTEPRMWLLGSSMYSAHLAAAKGLPYVFAHHFSGQGTAEALEVYRSEFRPSDLATEPVTFLTVNAAVAETQDEAMALLLPNLQMMARLRTGQPLGPVDLVEDAEAEAADSAGAGGRGRRAALEPSSAIRVEAAEQVRALAEEFDVDEVMVHPVASARRGTDPATAPARSRRSNCSPKSCSRALIRGHLEHQLVPRCKRGQGAVGIDNVCERKRRDGRSAKMAVDYSIEAVVQELSVLARLQRDDKGHRAQPFTWTRIPADVRDESAERGVRCAHARNVHSTQCAPRSPWE